MRERTSLVVALLASVAALVFIVPLVALLARAPWGSMQRELSRPVVADALELSIVTSIMATVIAAVLGLPLAWCLARARFPGRRLIRALATLPMVLPPVVGGVALLLAFGRRGLIGSWLYDAFGVSLPFTTAGVVLAEAFVAMPFLILASEAAFEGVDRRREEAARTLGASRWMTFRRVTLPSTRPALVAGLVLCWARALGEFGATITFAGSFRGTTQTVPLAVYLQLEAGQADGAIALSLVLVALSIGVLVALRERWRGAR